MSENRVGTCLDCGGAVIADWQAVHPIPHCIGCGKLADCRLADYVANTTPAVTDDVRRLQQEKDGMKV